MHWALACALSCSLGTAAAVSGGVRWDGLLAGIACTSLIAFHGGVMPLAFLAALFVLGVMATRLGAARKRCTSSGPHELRGAQHVLANAGPAVLLLLWDNGPSGRWAAAASLCGALADTLSSEIGMLAASPPRLLLLGPVVPTGTDGGMSWCGTAVAVAVAALAALCVALLGGSTFAAFCLGAGAFATMLCDSVLGASIERCFSKALGNHAVNFLAASAGGCITLALMSARA